MRLIYISGEATNRILASEDKDAAYAEEIQRAEDEGIIRVDMVEAIRSRMWERDKSWVVHPKSIASLARVAARYSRWVKRECDMRYLLDATKAAGVPLYMAAHLFYAALDDEYNVLDDVLEAL